MAEFGCALKKVAADTTKDGVRYTVTFETYGMSSEVFQELNVLHRTGGGLHVTVDQNVIQNTLGEEFEDVS